VVGAISLAGNDVLAARKIVAEVIATLQS